MFRGDKPELSFSEEIFTSMWRLGQTFGCLALLEYLSFLFFFFFYPCLHLSRQERGILFCLPQSESCRPERATVSALIHKG